MKLIKKLSKAELDLPKVELLNKLRSQFTGYNVQIELKSVTATISVKEW